MNILDELQKRLSGYFNEVTHEVNYVKIFDTPHVWGEDFSKDIMNGAMIREREFEKAITDLIEKMRYRCDISSLNAPDEEWRKIILSAIDRGLTKNRLRKEKVQIRFLFAQTPTSLLNGIGSYFEGTPEYIELKKDILKLIDRRGKYWGGVPDIWIGRFYRIVEGVKTSLDKKLHPNGMISDMDTRMTWNHTKIIAIDGSESFVGGHNLNMDLFTSYPPVHDVSMKVLGDAAYASQLFLNKMWEAGTDLLTKETINSVEGKWENMDHVCDVPHDPLRMKYIYNCMKRQQKIYSRHPEEEGYQKSSRILSVGKYWTGPDMEKDYQDGSEIMKEFLIKKAKRKIRISQQDLVSAWKSTWSEHKVCRWLIEALLSNPDLEVQIVVSPLDGAAGAAGDQYSFGSGAKRTYELFKYYLTHDEKTDEIISDPTENRISALKRLKIAPLFFTDKVPSNLCVEGETYKWPEAEEGSYTATLKEMPLEKEPPKKGKIGHPLMAVLKGSGLLYPKVSPAPGNHAKITIIDDELFVIGSDNLYPGYLSEFNYVVEGEEAVTYFINSYWNSLWKYSSKHIVS
jgi:murine toxin